MDDDKQNTKPNPRPDDAPAGSKMDKNGVWRNRSGHILPGQVLNPNGLRLNAQSRAFKEAAQSHSLDVLDMLYEITMDNTRKAADRIKAGDIILDRAFGKPTSVVQADVTDYTPRPIILGLDKMEAMTKEDDEIVNAGEKIIIEDE